MNITKQDAENLLDVLAEWYETCEPKELEENETGLTLERYKDIIVKLTQITVT
jgi:hypothetical protein